MTVERPSYVDKKTGLSSEYAKKTAERFEKMDALKNIIDSSLPTKESLNWMESTAPYVVKDSDKKGLLEILKNNIPNTKLGDLNYARIAYYHCFKQVENTKNTPGATQEKLWDINVIETGDKIFVKNGKIIINRKDGSKYASFSIDLYPWSGAATAPSTTTPPAPTKPAETPAPSTPPAAESKKEPEATPPAAPTTPSKTPPTAPARTIPPNSEISKEVLDRAYVSEAQIQKINADLIAEDLDNYELSKKDELTLVLKNVDRGEKDTIKYTPNLKPYGDVGSWKGEKSTVEALGVNIHELVQYEIVNWTYQNALESIHLMGFKDPANQAPFTLKGKDIIFTHKNGTETPIFTNHFSVWRNEQMDKVLAEFTRRYEENYNPLQRSFDNDLAQLNQETDEAKIKQRVNRLLRPWTYFIQPIEVRDGNDYSNIREHLPTILEALKTVCSTPNVQATLARTTLILGLHGSIDDEDAGVQGDKQGHPTIVIDYDESAQTIAQDITEAANRIERYKQIQEALPSADAKGVGFKLFSYSEGADLGYDYEDIQKHLTNLEKAADLVTANASPAMQEKLKTQKIYLGENALTTPNNEVLNYEEKWFSIDYDETPEEIAAQIQHAMVQLYPELNPNGPTAAVEPTPPAATPASAPATTTETAPEKTPQTEGFLLNGAFFNIGKPSLDREANQGIYAWQENGKDHVARLVNGEITAMALDAQGNHKWHNGQNRQIQVKNGKVVFFGTEQGSGAYEGEKLTSGGKEGGLFRADGDHLLIEGKRTYNNGTIEEGKFENNRLVEGTKTKPDGTVEYGEFDEKGKLIVYETDPKGISSEKGIFYGTYTKGRLKDGYQTYEKDGQNYMNIVRNNRYATAEIPIPKNTGEYRWKEGEGAEQIVTVSGGKLQAYGILSPDGSTWTGYAIRAEGLYKGTFDTETGAFRTDKPGQLKRTDGTVVKYPVKTNP